MAGVVGGVEGGVAMSKPLRPRWTVFYNIVNAGESYIGMGWEFFYYEDRARERCNSIPTERTPGYSGPVCGTMRPFHDRDKSHMGAVHQWDEWFQQEQR